MTPSPSRKTGCAAPAALAYATAFALALAAIGSPALAARKQNPDLLERLRSYRFGSDPTLPDATDAWVHSSLQQASARREVARRLAGLLRPDLPFDVRQLVCRELVLVATPSEIPALLPLLHDPRLAPYALLVLERIPGPAVDRALLEETPRLHGEGLIGVLDAFAARRTRAAIPQAAKLLASPEPGVADAAATALAWIGGPEAARILRTAVLRNAGGLRSTAAHALLALADRERLAGHIHEALACYRTLEHVGLDEALSAAALRGTALAMGASGVPELLKVLAKGSLRMQDVAAGTLREMPGSAATHAICSGLDNLPPQARTLVIEALADRRDPSARAAVARQISSRDPGVRNAALRALGSLGNVADVPALIRAAAHGTAADRQAASSSLVELRAPGVDARLIEAAKNSSGQVRLAVIHALADRSVAASVPILLSIAAGPDNQAGAAAARALRDLASPAQLAPLVRLMMRAAPDRAELLADTVSDIARRCPDPNAPVALLERTLSAAKEPARRSLILETLAQLQGERPLADLRAALHDPAADVRATALRLLAEWQTSEPAADLLAIARSSSDAAERAIALRGFIRLVAQDPSLPPAAALDRYREALALAGTADERRQVLSGIAKVRSRDALDLAASFLQNAEVRPEAEAAVVQVAACTAGAWPEDTRRLLAEIAGSSASEDVRRRAAQLLQTMDRFGDFDMAWEVSPPYFRAGADYAHLFDIPFAPELPGARDQVPWQLMPVGMNPEQPWLLDLLALWGGEQRAAYLRSRVWCDASRDLLLSVGSDDGVKAWWNGDVVVAQNVARAVAPDQNRATVHARAGWNTLMLKITQNVMGWGACVRFLNPDGSPAAGLRFSVPSAAAAGR